jgi:hypothetical protein
MSWEGVEGTDLGYYFNIRSEEIHDILSRSISPKERDLLNVNQETRYRTFTDKVKHNCHLPAGNA